jgi:hypothetical protein
MDRHVDPQGKQPAKYTAISTSIPIIVIDCCGINRTIEIIRMLISRINESKARPGSFGMDNILARLIETPTNINPVNAAEAPAVATNRSCHSFMA